MSVSRIQHNLSAMNALSNYAGNSGTLTGNLEKLSSGFRINSAADDAAGLAISEKMRSQIAGLEKAQDNANDGISLVQTAEGALTEVNSMLTRLTTLATQSANGTYEDGVDRANLQEETNALLEEIDRISQSTNFNGINLLDGSLSKASETTINVSNVMKDGSNVSFGGHTYTFSASADGSDGDTFRDAGTLANALTKNGFTATAGVDVTAKASPISIESPFAKIKGSVEVGFTKLHIDDSNQDLAGMSSTTYLGIVSAAIAGQTEYSDSTGTYSTGTYVSITGSLGGDEGLKVSSLNINSDLLKDCYGITASIADAETGEVTLSASGNFVTSTTPLALDGGAGLENNPLNSYAGYVRLDFDVEAADGTTHSAASITVHTTNSAGTANTLSNYFIGFSADAETYVFSPNEGYAKTGVGSTAEELGFVVTSADIDANGHVTTASVSKTYIVQGNGTLQDNVNSTLYAGGGGASNDQQLFASIPASGSPVLVDSAGTDVTTAIASVGGNDLAQISKESTGFTGYIQDKFGSNIRLTSDEMRKAAKDAGYVITTSGSNPPTASLSIDTATSSLSGERDTSQYSKMSFKYNGVSYTIDKNRQEEDTDASDRAVTVKSEDSLKDQFGLKVTVDSTSGSVTASIEDMNAVAVQGDILKLQVGDTNTSFQKVTVDIEDMSSVGLGLKGLDISSQEAAGKAIDTIKNAVNLVSMQRGKLGAMQNRLDHTLNNLDATTQNIQAAESQIRDVDMAKEMTQYSKNNILVQAAQSMLAQANSLPQGVLSLLQ